MWPADRPDLKARVAWAFAFLVAAKLVTASVPFFFKYATDTLNGEAEDLAWLPTILLTPVMLVVGYNVARIVQVALNQLRDALFARVGQHAVRQLAYRTFTHMHRLSLRFHLARRTGGLSRIIERGTKGIETIVRFTILNTLPTILEFALYAGIFAWNFGWSYVLVIALTVWAYAWFTIRASDWRIGIRRQMNDSDTDANTKAIDSLLNFETVKYFGNERMEARPFRLGDGRLRVGRDQNVDIARMVELRPRRHLLDRHGRLHGHVGACRRRGNADHRRLRAHQHVPDAALHPFELHRFRLP